LTIGWFQTREGRKENILKMLQEGERWKVRMGARDHSGGKSPRRRALLRPIREDKIRFRMLDRQKIIGLKHVQIGRRRNTEGKNWGWGLATATMGRKMAGKFSFHCAAPKTGEKAAPKKQERPCKGLERMLMQAKDWPERGVQLPLGNGWKTGGI